MLTILFALALAAQPASAVPTTKLVLLDLEGDADVASVTRATLRPFLRDDPRLSIEAMASPSTCFSIDCIVTVGTQAEAPLVLFGKGTRTGKNVEVDLVLVDVKRRKELGRERVTAADLEALSLPLRRATDRVLSTSKSLPTTPPKSTLLLLPLGTDGVDVDNHTAAITAAVAQQLAQDRRFYVVTDPTVCAAEACLATLAKQNDAPLIVYGTVSHVGTEPRVMIGVYRRTAKASETRTAQAPTLEALMTPLQVTVEGVLASALNAPRPPYHQQMFTIGSSAFGLGLVAAAVGGLGGIVNEDELNNERDADDRAEIIKQRDLFNTVGLVGLGVAIVGAGVFGASFVFTE